MLRTLLWAFAVVAIQTPLHATENQTVTDPAAFVRSVIDAPRSQTDFAWAKLTIDTFVDPSADADAALAEIDAMVATIERMLTMIPPEAAATDAGKMEVLRDYLYRAGWWNENRPYAYDMDDLAGQKLANALLPSYLASRKGKCVSMPILVLILGERLGLDMTLSIAPEHVLLKWTDKTTGQTHNFEATSAKFGSDSQFRIEMPMSDAAVANGVYLKTLTRREALALAAIPALEHLIAMRRYEEAIAVADVLLEAYPALAHALIEKGSAYYKLLEENFMRKYPKESDIPPDELPYALSLYRANLEAFARAEALGWRESDLDRTAELRKRLGER